VQHWHFRVAPSELQRRDAYREVDDGGELQRRDAYREVDDGGELQRRDAYREVDDGGELQRRDAYRDAIDARWNDLHQIGGSLRHPDPHEMGGVEIDSDINQPHRRSVGETLA
jgi:hypothetical protein